MARVLVIISSQSVEKALTGLMWATNAFKNRWVEDVEVIFFGPVERLIAEGNERLMHAIIEYSGIKGRPLACRRIAEKEGYEDKLEGKVNLVYVGSLIGNYLEENYVPMVF
ncbi:MAG: hypothetical protein F7B19_07365 [Desulfurococcales archaeon]|nr:hypothetical protein [Desulfurococcales archaeon]